jgi:hypothetical protein
MQARKVEETLQLDMGTEVCLGKVRDTLSYDEQGMAS